MINGSSVSYYTNRYPTIMDDLPKTVVQFILAAKW